MFFSVLHLSVVAQTVVVALIDMVMGAFHVVFHRGTRTSGITHLVVIPASRDGRFVRWCQTCGKFIETMCGDSGQVWGHTPKQRVAASILWRYSFGLRLAITQADAMPAMLNIFQIRLCLTHLWSVWTPPWHGPAPRISIIKNPMGGILANSRAICPERRSWRFRTTLVLVIPYNME